MFPSVKKVTDADKPILSPALLQEIQEDPSKMEALARLMGAVNLDNLFRAMQNPDVNPNARMEFQKILNKMGKLEPDNKAQQTGANVVINITRARDAEDAIVISGSQEAIEA